MIINVSLTKGTTNLHISAFKISTLCLETNVKQRKNIWIYIYIYKTTPVTRTDHFHSTLWYFNCKYTQLSRYVRTWPFWWFTIKQKRSLCSVSAPTKWSWGSIVFIMTFRRVRRIINFLNFLNEFKNDWGTYALQWIFDVL